jgi:hypothetical protein
MAATKVHNDRKSCLDLLFDVACGSESKAMKMWSIVGEKCTFSNFQATRAWLYVLARI